MEKTITITYNANGGTGGPGTQTGNVYNSATSYTFTISSTKPTRTGYIFKGWNTNSQATSASYQPEAKVTFSSNVTLYAIWELAIAQIGSTQYPSIQSAMNAVPSTNTQTTVLLLVSTTENFTINSGKKVNFNLNGKTVSGLCTNNGTATLYGGTISGVNSHAIYNNGTINITSGTYKLDDYGYTIQNNGTLNISGGRIEVNSYGVEIYNAKTLNMTGGTVKSNEYGIVSANELSNGQIVAVANLSNVTVTASDFGIMCGNRVGSTSFYGKVKATNCNITGSTKYNTATHETSLGIYINCGGSGAITGRVVDVKTDSSGFNITMYDSGVEANVQFPTWTNNNGQDDLVWHSGTFNANNYWTCRINRSDHKNETGTYTVHVYRVENGTRVCVTTEISLTF